jgi:hypothetical protein
MKIQASEGRYGEQDQMVPALGILLAWIDPSMGHKEC